MSTDSTAYFRFEKLEVWREAKQICKEVYECIQSFPRHEEYALKDQIRRAITSTVLNIAEGAAYKSDKEFVKFLYYAKGSLYETVTALFLAYDFGYTNLESTNTLKIKLNALDYKINSLIKYLSNKKD